jgi:hypothetical protein
MESVGRAPVTEYSTVICRDCAFAMVLHVEAVAV